MSDLDHDIEQERSLCFELAAAAFAGDQLDLERYEALAVEIAEARRLAELKLIRTNLPEVEVPPQEPQLINAQGSSIRRTGRWLTSPNLVVESRGSSVRLDFRDYDDAPNFRLMLRLDCRGSNLRIIVPEGIDVIEEIESNRASVYRDKRRPRRPNGAILISGSITGSKIKVVHKRAR